MRFEFGRYKLSLSERGALLGDIASSGMKILIWTIQFVLLAVPIAIAKIWFGGGSIAQDIFDVIALVWALASAAQLFRIILASLEIVSGRDLNSTRLFRARNDSRVRSRESVNSQTVSDEEWARADLHSLE